MLRKIIINPGEKFGKLTVLKEEKSIDHNGYKKRMVLCVCDCGNKKSVRLEYLRKQHTKSCGCLRGYELLKINKTHGKSKTKLHGVWASILSRCNNKNVRGYHNYGGRGIKICEEWLEFESFLNWSNNNGYKEGLSIERINNDGDYCPNNCEFTTKTAQANNKRNNKFFTFNGRTMTLPQWSRFLKINQGTLSSRIKNGWDINRAFSVRVRKFNDKI